MCLPAQAALETEQFQLAGAVVGQYIEVGRKLAQLHREQRRREQTLQGLLQGDPPPASTSESVGA